MKKFKQNLQVLCLLIVFSNVTLGNAGAMSNQGDTGVSRKVTAEEVTQAINDSVFILNGFIERSKNNNSQITVQSWAITAKELSLLEKVRIHLQYDEPCLDSSGNESDSSILSLDNFEICISSARLETKLTPETLVSELNALIAHELALLVGFNETDSLYVQQSVQQNLRSLDIVPIKKAAEDFILELNRFAASLDSNYLKDASNLLYDDLIFPTENMYDAVTIHLNNIRRHTENTYILDRFFYSPTSGLMESPLWIVHGFHKRLYHTSLGCKGLSKWYYETEEERDEVYAFYLSNFGSRDSINNLPAPFEAIEKMNVENFKIFSEIKRLKQEARAASNALETSLERKFKVYFYGGDK